MKRIPLLAILLHITTWFQGDLEASVEIGDFCNFKKSGKTVESIDFMLGNEGDNHGALLPIEYSPYWGVLMHLTNYLSNLRLKGNIEAVITGSPGTRDYQQDKGADGVTELIKKLYPSNAGMLQALYRSGDNIAHVLEQIRSDKGNNVVVLCMTRMLLATEVAQNFMTKKITNQTRALQFKESIVDYSR